MRFLRRGTILGGRGGHADDWASPHHRARSRAAERLVSPLDPAEAAWLDDHLAGCDGCRLADSAYLAQRSDLLRLRDEPPVPPRDLWARTAAAIEREPTFRERAGRRAATRIPLAPYALLGSALVVAVVVGTLNSSQLIDGDATPPPSATPEGFASAPPTPGATPLLVGLKRVEWLTVETDGSYRLNVANVDRVCPESATSCDAAVPDDEGLVEFGAAATTVFGTTDPQRLIVIASTADRTSSSLFVVPVTTPGPTPTDSIAPTAPPTPTPTPTPTGVPPSPSPTIDPSVAPSTGPTPSISPLPGGAIEIARGLAVDAGSAAYSASGDRFAFSARPATETPDASPSLGPDIYTWRAGEAQARPVTGDGRSVFGSWSGGRIVGSRAVLEPDGTITPAAFLVDPDTGAIVALPQVGRAWRPAVDPQGWNAVYWNGTLEPAADGSGWTTGIGALVLGNWGVATAEPSASPSPSPTPLDGDQATERHETTIATGPLSAWDVGWDASGTRLAVWIADAADPTVGRLSLYVVDPFDGRIDLAAPVLADAPAFAGFSISDGRLVWAEPTGDGNPARRDARIQVLAWTEEGTGTIESPTGSVIIVR